MRRVLAALVTVASVTVACAAPSDDDGESVAAAGRLPAAPPPAEDARVVVVDTDLGGDDLAALAFLLRRTDVRVAAITIAATGLVGCEAGVDVVADLLTALNEPAVTLSCGREDPGPGGRALPAAWRTAAEAGSGIPRDPLTLPTTREDAAEVISRVAARGEPLTVVALGPLTNLADLVTDYPDAAQLLAGIHAMGGSVDGRAVDGVAEWNAAADPEAFGTVLSSGVPLTLVPEDAVPTGTPDALDVPVVAQVAAANDYPAWWDLAAAAAVVAPGAAQAEDGRWELDRSTPGRLRRVGDGPVRVVRSLDRAALEAEYAATFDAGP